MDINSGHEIALPYSPQRKLQIEFSKRYNRAPHADQTLESTIETTWALRSAENPSLFNGTKFRFSGIALDGEVCTLRLGLTDYKTYLGTHSLPDAGTKFGERCMAQPLGNVVIPETSDGKTVLLVRSSHSGEGAGAVVFPGGHPEPDMVEGLQESDTRVEQELWVGARREVLEELWIGDDEVCRVEEMVFLGMVRRTGDGKVSMVFSAKIELSGEQVLKRFCEKNDGVESDRLVATELGRMESVTGVTLDGMDVAAETRGAASLWMAMHGKEMGLASWEGHDAHKGDGSRST